LKILSLFSAHRRESGEGGEEWDSSVTVTIGEGDQSVAVERNGQIRMTCRGSHDEQELEWTRADGQQLPPNAQLEGKTLTISSLGVRSSGQYICRPKEGSGSDKVVVDIVVLPGMTFTETQSMLFNLNIYTELICRKRRKVWKIHRSSHCAESSGYAGRRRRCDNGLRDI
jgi:hypothetical protein